MSEAPELQMVAALERLLRQGDAIGVLGRAEAAAQRFPFAGAFRYLRAAAMARLGAPAEAAEHIAQVVTTLPLDLRPAARAELASARLAAGQADQALAEADAWLASHPEDVAMRAIRATALVAAGRAEDAAPLVGPPQAGEDDLDLVVAAAGLALATEPRGDGPRSAAAIERLTAQAGKVGGAAPTRGEALRLLGELHARRGQNADAWHAFRRAAKLAHSAAFVPQRYGAEAAKLIESWPVSQVSRQAGSAREPAASSDRPVFVLGYPDGTAEALAACLAAHPAAVAARHAGTVAAAALRHLGAARGSYQAMIIEPKKLAPPRLADAGAFYLEYVAPGSTAARIIDQSPTTVHQAGALMLALPASRMIWVRSDPVRACLSAGVGPFHPHLPFTHEMLKAATYWHACDQMWQRWRELAAARGYAVLEVSGEDMLADPGRVVNEALAFIGLSREGGVDAAEAKVRERFARETRFDAGLADRFPQARDELARLFGPPAVAR